MPDLTIKELPVEAANRHIAEAKGQIYAQRQRLAQLENNSPERELAEKFLTVMQELLKFEENHRRLIQTTIHDISDRALPS